MAGSSRRNVVVASKIGPILEVATDPLTENAPPALEHAQGYWPTPTQVMLVMCSITATCHAIGTFWVASPVLRHDRILGLPRLLSCTARATASSDPLQR